MQDILRLAQIGVGATTGNPYLMANGLLNSGIGTSIQELMNDYDEWAKRKAMAEQMEQANAGYGINPMGYGSYNHGMTFNR